MWIGYFIEWVEEIILIFNTLLLTQWVAISRTMFFPSALDPLLPPCALLLLPLLFSISGRSTLMFPCHCAFLFKAATSSSSSPFFISRPPLPRPASPILFFGRQQHQLLRCFSSLIFLNSSLSWSSPSSSSVWSSLTPLLFLSASSMSFAALFLLGLLLLLGGCRWCFLRSSLPETLNSQLGSSLPAFFPSLLGVQVREWRLFCGLCSSSFRWVVLDFVVSFS